MFLRKIAAVSTLAIAATVLTVGPAGADPHTPAAVNYTATTSPSNTVISIDSGSLSTEGGIFAIKAEDGTVLAGTPLQFRVDDFLFPIAAEINDKTATLTPRFDLEHAVYQPVALPFEDQANWKTPTTARWRPSPG